jgi:hypothetical protein
VKRNDREPITPDRLPYVLFRRAAVPALVAAAICVMGAAVWSGIAGLVGAGIGAVIVALFYWTDLLVLRLSERLVGEALMPLMLTEYLIKVAVLAILLFALWDTTAFDMRSLAVTVAVATVVWTVALGVSAARAATFVVDVSAHRETDRK